MIYGHPGDILPAAAIFPDSKAALSTVGYTLYNTDGSVHQARTTVGVVGLGAILGKGWFIVGISQVGNWSGYIVWDTGEGSLLYTDPEEIYISDSIDPAVIQAIKTNTDRIPAFPARSEEIADILVKLPANPASKQDVDAVPAATWITPNRTLTALGTSAGVGAHVLTVTVTVDGVVSQNHEVYVFKSDGTPVLGAKTGANGVATLNLDNGDYLVKVIKPGVWTKEQLVTIAGINAAVTIATTTATVPGFVTFTLVKQPVKRNTWNIGETEKLGVKVICDQGAEFVVGAATYTITKPDGTVTEPAAATVENADVFLKLSPLVEGKHVIELKVPIGDQVLLHYWTIYAKKGAT
ncbi:MAG: hypothetical protein ACYC0N_00605 [Carboxydocellales bacterium]